MYIMQSVLVEAVIVGILVVLIGFFVNSLLNYMTKNNKNLNKYLTNDIRMIILLFFIGVLTHLLCEAFGLNKWYCNNGHACK